MGVDLGTSSFKACAFGVDGRPIGCVRRPTPWSRSSGNGELDPGAFGQAVRSLVDECAAEHGAGQVVGVGVTGMAETVFVRTHSAQVLPARAWNERDHDAAAEPDASAFARTGLIDLSRATAVRLRRLRDTGVAIAGWSGLPEQAVQLLGGERVQERSLASRTGLVDVVRGGWDEELVAWAGVEDALPHEVVAAGTAAGVVREGVAAGATLTVAGHDHVVAAIGAGAYGAADVFDSIGTGEAVLTQIARHGADLDVSTVSRLRSLAINVGLGLDVDDRIALAGLGTGNRFNVLLDALEEAGFARPDVVAAEGAPSATEQEHVLVGLPTALGAVVSRLFGPDWQELRRTGEVGAAVAAAVTDLAAARAVWWAAVVHASRNARAALNALTAPDGAHPRLVAAGGWLRNAGLVAVRARELGHFHVPDVDECGARGAALLAGLAAGVYSSRQDLPPIAEPRSTR
ncbi:FGGY family carbohydrate kinase [Angustibacter speluncae]